MGNPSISLPDEMKHEIEERREKGTNRSAYIREAVQARFNAEDADDWDDVEDPLKQLADGGTLQTTTENTEE